MVSYSAPGLPLCPGSRIAIIGGGPAGSFFALHLLRRAPPTALPLEVTIYESKDFSTRGPPGCNRCAGILSSHLVQAMEAFGLLLPAETIMARITGYRLFMGGGQIYLPPPTPSRRILSVYRGSGPRLGALTPTVSFDAWLLEQAARAGTRVIRTRVQAVAATPEGIRLQVSDQWEPFDLVVLAAGVNSRLPQLQGLPYQPPRMEAMAQDEIVWPPLWGDSPTKLAEVYVYSGFSSGLLFAALVPKGPYVNVSLLGHRLPRDAVGNFLGYLQEEHGHSMAATTQLRLCGCRPRIAVAAARGFFADRFVAVGDAVATRLYKDGIGTAFETAQQAAVVALSQGIAQSDFARNYQPLCQAIDRDNRAGHWLFRIWSHLQRNRWAQQAWLHALAAEDLLPANRRPCHEALWGLFTGDISYRHIVGLLSSRQASAALLRGLLAALHSRAVPFDRERGVDTLDYFG